MKVADPSIFVGGLTTVGRRSGLQRTVELRLIRLSGKFYATSSNVERKHWCRNMSANPAVSVTAGGERFACRARRVDDEELRRRVLKLRDTPPLLERVVFELAPLES
jgi:deazaflavin-dependent oxidoreductase (nitroreductase family)